MIPMIILTLLGQALAFILGRRYGFMAGYNSGVKDEQLLMGASILKAYPGEEGALKKVGVEYNKLIQKINNKEAI